MRSDADAGTIENAEGVTPRGRRKTRGGSGERRSTAPPLVPEALRPTLADEAYQELKRRIVMIELGPGSSIREADLAATLGFGKTPVREALLRLRLEGLVRVQSRAGYTVAPVTLKDARDVCELRALLEEEAAGRAAMAGGNVVDELRSVEAVGRRMLRDLDLARVGQDKESLTTWLDTDRAFHVGLGRASGNALLVETLDSLLERFARLCYLACALGPSEPFPPHEHGEIVAAITAGDIAETRALAVREIRRAESWLIQALLRSESLSTTNVDATPDFTPRKFYLDVPAEAAKGGRRK
jgi:GntR family transcriptional regulator, rspAB operon transcriptional repressor